MFSGRIEDSVDDNGVGREIGEAPVLSICAIEHDRLHFYRVSGTKDELKPVVTTEGEGSYISVGKEVVSRTRSKAEILTFVRMTRDDGECITVWVLLGEPSCN